MNYIKEINNVIFSPSIDDIINKINENNGKENNFLGEKIAGQYAYHSQIESDYDVCDDSIDVHLDTLIKNGSNFDYQIAFKESKRLRNKFKNKKT